MNQACMPAPDDLLSELVGGPNREVRQPRVGDDANATDVSPTHETMRALVEAPTQTCGRASQNDLQNPPTLLLQAVSYIVENVDRGTVALAKKLEGRHVRLP